MRWTIRAELTAPGLAVLVPLAAGAGFRLWFGYRAAVAEEHGLAARFLFMTGDTANRSAWQFLQEVRMPVLAKPFTPQAPLRTVDRVGA